MTTEMTKTESKAMTTQQPSSGWGNIDSSDLVVARIRLVQPQTQDPGNCTPGQYLNTLTGDAIDDCTIVPLAIQRGRSWFPEGSDRPECWSRDAMAPSDKVQDPQNDICDGCQLAEWGENRKPPQCRDQYNVMALMVEEGDIATPVVMTIKGMSIKPFKALLTFGQLRGLEPYMIQCVMGSTEKRGKKERYYVSSFGCMQTVAPNDKYAEHFASMTGQSVKVAVDGETAEAEEDLPF